MRKLFFILLNCTLSAITAFVVVDGLRLMEPVEARCVAPTIGCVNE